jgi:NAD(P)H-hydrate epimerase
VIVAVDCPSGLDADTGALDSHALPADLSVTMAFPKRGMLRGAGVDACGELVVVGIGLPPKLKEVDDLPLEMVTAEWVRARLPRRPASGHKDTFGRVLIIAGSLNYTGAASLAGAGAFRVGAGLVQLGLPGPLHAAVASRLPEATFLLLPHDRGALTVDAAGVVQKELEHFKALLVGPGIGHEDSTAQFIERLFGGGAARRAHIGFLAHEDAGQTAEEPHTALPPLVVDADGLNLLAKLDDWPRRLPASTVLTPHAGEMARLLKIERDAVQADRIATAQRAAKESGHVVVLKGAYTVVAAPDARTVVEPWVNSGLAHAGTGDVLSGAIAGLLAQGLAPFEAAACGAYLHGLAGALAREEYGAAGMLAGDVAQALADAVAILNGE